MKKDSIAKLHSQFNQMTYQWEDSDVEFWFARDLQRALGYANWQNFRKVVDKAIEACVRSGHAGGCLLYTSPSPRD